MNNKKSTTQDTSTKTKNLQRNTLKTLNRFWRKIQFWKPTKYQALLGFRENNT